MPQAGAQTGNQEAKKQDAPDDAALREYLERQAVRLAGVLGDLLAQLKIRCLVVVSSDAEQGVRGEVLPGHLPEHIPVLDARGAQQPALLPPLGGVVVVLVVVN